MFVVWMIYFIASAVCEGRLDSGCDADEFPCGDGSCVEKTRWCDAELDCRDGSDEKFCFTSSNLRPVPNRCDETFFFRCRDGPCIPLTGRCDGYFSCMDRSDEEACPTLHFEETRATWTASVDFGNYSTDIPTTTRFPSSNEGDLKPVSNDSLFINDSRNVVQRDLGGMSKPESADQDLGKGFKAIDVRNFQRERVQAQRWLLSVRDQDFGWGDETPRALVALYTSDDDLLPKQRDGKLLMSKQLHLKLFSSLIRNRTEPIPLSELSLFVNALSASCDDPRNFYGQDLIGILRHRTSEAEASSKFVTPLVYLTLCLNGATTDGDLVKVREILQRTPKIDRMDVEALVSLSATCMSRLPKFASDPSMRQVATGLYQKVARHGLPENIYQLALVTQALNEARIHPDRWNRSDALELMRRRQDAGGSFGDLLSTYYALPVLSGRSLLSVGHHCEAGRGDLTPLEVLKNGDYEKISVRYSLYFGNPLEVSQTLMIRVKKSTNFFDIMRVAATIDPVYKFRYVMSEGRPDVYSIGGVVNDPERGLYWKLYLESGRNATTAGNGLTYEGDIRNLIPRVEDSVVFWMKSPY